MAEDRAHALLSASSAYRWTVCTAAPKYEEQFADSSSWAAQEGTIAHAVAEYALNREVEAGRETDGITALEVPQVNEFYDHYVAEYPGEPEKALAEYTSLLRYVQEYVDYVKAIPGYRYIEVKVGYSHIAEEGFGTSDAIILNDAVLDVVDLKYGKGKKVYADGPQAKLYAIGAIKELAIMLNDVKRVRLHIVQPRLDWVDVHEMTIEELNEYAQWLKTKADEAMAGGVFQAGDHCDFCRGRKQCKARADYYLEVARADFYEEPCPDVNMLTIEDIGGLVPRLEGFIKWAKELQDHALELALSGTAVPGHKVVEGRSIRKWLDEAQVAEAMRANGLTTEQIYNMKLIGIGDAEKLLGKKSDVFNLAVKAPGSPTLVPESDKRPEIGRAQLQADFGAE